MSIMNGFSIVLIIITIFIAYRSNFNIKTFYVAFFTLALIMEICFPKGYFIHLFRKFYYSVYSLMLLLVLSMYILYKNKKYLNRSIQLISLVFIIEIIVSYLYEIVNPIDHAIMNCVVGMDWDGYVLGTTSKMNVTFNLLDFLLRLMCICSFTSALVVVKCFFYHDDYCFVFKWCNRALFINLIYVMGEFVTRNIYSSDIMLKTTNVFFGLVKGDTPITHVMGMTQKNGYWVLQGISREPSHLAFTLFLTIIFIFFEKKYILDESFNTADYVKIFISVLLLYFSGSFSSFLYFAILLLLLVYYFKEKYGWRKFFGVAIIFFITALGITGIIQSNGVGLLDYYFGKFDALILVLDLLSNDILVSVSFLSVDGFGSVLARMVSIYDTFCDFLTRPLLGLGLGVQFSHSGFVNILSYIGLLGLICWWKLLFINGKYLITPFILIVIVPNLLAGFDFLGFNSIFGSLYTIVVVQALKIGGEKM